MTKNNDGKTASIKEEKILSYNIIFYTKVVDVTEDRGMDCIHRLFVNLLFYKAYCNCVLVAHLAHNWCVLNLKFLNQEETKRAWLLDLWCYGEAVVQWSAFRHGSLGSQLRIPDICWAIFNIWYHHQVGKDYPSCCHTVLRRDFQCLYAFEAVAAISLSRSQHIQEKA